MDVDAEQHSYNPDSELNRGVCSLCACEFSRPLSELKFKGLAVFYMGKVKNFPGRNCFFNRYEHCIAEELDNPGYKILWHCTVLTTLEKSYDFLIHQADAFRLSLRQTELIWEKRFENLYSWEDLCSAYIARIPEDDRCVYLYGNACILKMPMCQGICTLFKSRSEKDIESL